MPILAMILIGAALGMGTAYLIQKIRGKPVTWKTLALAAGLGAFLGPLFIGMGLASVAGASGAAAAGTMAGETVPPVVAYGASVVGGVSGGVVAANPDPRSHPREGTEASANGKILAHDELAGLGASTTDAPAPPPRTTGVCGALGQIDELR